MSSPPVHRRQEPSRAERTQPRSATPPRPAAHSRTGHRRGPRRSPWEGAGGAGGSQVLASFVLVLAAIAWLVTFYFVLTFVW